MKYTDKCQNGHSWIDFRYTSPSGKSKCRICANKRNRDYSKKHPARFQVYSRKKWLKKAYNMTPEQVDELFTQQGSKCRICQTSDFGRKGPVIDHHHLTNKVRGILCSNCNTAIGLLKENIPNIIAAACYLGHI